MSTNWNDGSEAAARRNQSDDDGVERDGCLKYLAWVVVVLVWAGITAAHLLA